MKIFDKKPPESPVDKAVNTIEKILLRQDEILKSHQDELLQICGDVLKIVREHEARIKALEGKNDKTNGA